MSKLVIVESPAKAKNIKGYLGRGYDVIASMGHVRDLPAARLSVDIANDFEPKYAVIKGKENFVKDLKKKADNADYVYLATDPDREGEAISWHLATLLGLDLKDKNRVTFNEITKNGVKNGMDAPRQIDIDLVDAQQARRILDRLIGYKLSPFISQKIRRGLSAGRVQSVALRLIVDRENEIRAFKAEEYWSIDAKFTNPPERKVFSASLSTKNGEKIKIENKEQSDSVLSDLDGESYIVKGVKKGSRKKNPTPPFITSTLQQEASRRLSFQARRTMKAAQELYEGVEAGELGTVGLITYMRTDSLRISEEARAVAKEVITQTYGANYYENRYYRQNKDAQDAHEGIRPTYIHITPDSIKDSLTADQYKLYKLIYNRFIASQMVAAVYDTISVDIDVNEYKFKASGQNLKFKGFMTLYVEGNDSKEDEEESTNIPKLELNQEVKKEKLDAKQSFTEPPARYTEASLVKELETKGIGRPSTYSPIITTIIERRYIEKDKKQLVPTQLGEVVNTLLTENFTDIIDVTFTARVEDEFDEVAEGKEEWKQILREFYPPFEKELEKVDKELEHVKLEDEVSDVKCDKCGRMMVVKMSRYGKFLACPGYPECKNIKPFVVTIDVPCPVCGGQVQVRKTKRGKNYYICENNKNTEESCKFISWDKPKVGEPWNPEEEKQKAPKRATRRKKTATKKTAKKATTKKKK